MLCLLEGLPNPLRLHPTSISYVFKVFKRTLICCGWAYGSILILLHHSRSGLDVGYLGVDLSLSDDVMPRRRLKPPRARGVFHISI